MVEYIVQTFEFQMIPFISYRLERIHAVQELCLKSLNMLRSRCDTLSYTYVSRRGLYAAADFGFLVPYFDREVIRFPTPPYHQD